MISRKLAALAAASLIIGTSPAVAQPAPASLATGARAGAAMGESSELGGGSGGLWAAAIGIALLAAAVLVVLDITDDDDEDFPVSP